MNQQTIQSVVALLEDKIGKGLRHLTLSFFGGEPLLKFDEVVNPLLNRVSLLCKQIDVKLNVGFTSNAYLLSSSMVEKICSISTEHPIAWQITLDGNSFIHDKTRRTIDKSGTFDRIISNIHLLVASGMQVLIRMNYTRKNVLSFYDIIDCFADLSKEQLNLIKVTFQQVWQDCNHSSKENEETLQIIDQIQKAFVGAGFNVVTKEQRRIRCYADKPNCVVINHDGSIFKCTAQDFKVSNSEGRLNEKGEIIYNDKYYARMNSIFSNAACRDCNIFPLCLGGCSQRLIYEHNKCIYSFCEEEKAHLVALHIQSIINNKSKNDEKK